MAEDVLVIPPIRQSLEDLTSAKDNELDLPKTEKSWYLYWERTGDRVNANTDKLGKLVTYGTHANRPPADSMPSGALYGETDRDAIYQNVNGTWTYVAGTMYGTLSPDLRPTDLGVNDGGFEFRGTDFARQYIWSQTEWIEVTAAQYGNHSARPNPTTIVQGALYCESDRSGVIYQNIGTAWKYRAGTMYGTLSPDQRPTDLGVNDGGFEFRGTDQQRHFIWSQSAWIEVTPPVATTGDVQQASATANLTLSTTPTPIPGTTITLNRAGRYLVTGIFSFVMNGADAGQGLRGKLFAGGADQGGLTLVTAFNAGTYAVTTQQWIYTAPSAGQLAYLSASKDGGTGNSQIQAAATTISALWVSA